MAYENISEQKISRFARWQKNRAVKKTYNLALKDLKTTKKFLEKYKPERTLAEKQAAAKEVNNCQQNYTDNLLQCLPANIPKNELYKLIAKHLASLRFIPEVKIFLASIYGNISIADRFCFNVEPGKFWENFEVLDHKNRAELLDEILNSENHHDHKHIVALFQKRLGHNTVHNLLNNPYLTANTRQKLLRLVFTSENRNSEAFGKLLFSENSHLSALDIREVLPNNAEDLPEALVAAFKDSLNSSILTLSDKFFVLDIMHKYPDNREPDSPPSLETLKKDIEILYNQFFSSSKEEPKNQEDQARLFALTLFSDIRKQDLPIYKEKQDVFLSILYKRLGIPPEVVKEKNLTECLEIIKKYIQQHLLLLPQKLCDLNILLENGAVILDKVFSEKVEVLRYRLFHSADTDEDIEFEEPEGDAEHKPLAKPLEAMSLSPEKGLELFHIDKISLRSYLGFMDKNNTNYEAFKHAAFDHALTSEAQRPALAELALLPNDFYGARRYIEEKSKPSLGTRFLRKVLGWAGYDKEGIKLTTLAQNTLKTSVPILQAIPDREEEIVIPISDEPVVIEQEISASPEPSQLPKPTLNSSTRILVGLHSLNKPVTQEILAGALQRTPIKANTVPDIATAAKGVLTSGTLNKSSEGDHSSEGDSSHSSPRDDEGQALDDNVVQHQQLPVKRALTFGRSSDSE